MQAIVTHNGALYGRVRPSVFLFVSTGAGNQAIFLPGRSSPFVNDSTHQINKRLT